MILEASILVLTRRLNVSSLFFSLKLFSLKKQHQNLLIENILIERKKEDYYQEKSKSFEVYPAFAKLKIIWYLDFCIYAFYLSQKLIITLELKPKTSDCIKTIAFPYKNAF